MIVQKLLDFFDPQIGNKFHFNLTRPWGGGVCKEKLGSGLAEHVTYNGSESILLAFSVKMPSVDNIYTIISRTTSVGDLGGLEPVGMVEHEDWRRTHSISGQR